MSESVPDQSALLAVAGLPDLTERVYLFVVHRGRTGPGDVQERFDLPPDRAAVLLEELRDLGLVARPSGSTDAYAAVDPRSSLNAISDRISDQVRRIRDQIPLLAEQFERSVADGSGTERTRVVSDSGDVASWYIRLQHQAKRELLSFDRPPYVSSPLEPLETSVIGGGVSWRVVYTAASFSEREEAWEETARLAEQGEQGRIVPDLPVKLVVADRSTALIALSMDGIHHDALVTESPPLVALMCEVFEHYWERGLPLHSTVHSTVHRTAADVLAQVGGEHEAAARVVVGGRPPTAEEQSILALIGSGLTDEAIAARLGLSVRSLRRRSQRLMGELGAANRFQLGVQASRRGWV